MAEARATNLLSAAGRTAGGALSFVDAFLAAAVGAFFCLLLIALIPSSYQQRSGPARLHFSGLNAFVSRSPVGSRWAFLKALRGFKRLGGF
jgi:hypothetical protein